MIKERNTTIDLIKLFCSFGVISIHVSSSTPAASYIGLFFQTICVPFFFIASLVYFIRSVHKQPANQLFSKIWHRLVIPLLSWTTIYVLLMTVKKVYKHQPANINWKSLLYGGAAVQLYYLPCLILMQFYIISFYFLLKGKNKLLGIGILAISILYHYIGYANKFLGFSALGTFIIFPLYILFSYLLSKLLTQQNKSNNLLVLIGLLLTLVSIGFNLNNFPIKIGGYPVVFLTGGLGLTMLAFFLPNTKIPSWLSNILSTSYGIYLCHVIFLEIFEIILEKVSHGKFVYDFANKLILTIIIFSASICFTLLIKKISFFKHLLLGEN